MKRSKRERKAYNEGYSAGRASGYAQGLYDGNPFNGFLDAVRNLVNGITAPAVLEAIKAAQEAEKEQPDYISVEIDDIEEGEQ